MSCPSSLRSLEQKPGLTPSIEGLRLQSSTAKPVQSSETRDCISRMPPRVPSLLFTSGRFTQASLSAYFSRSIASQAARSAPSAGTMRQHHHSLFSRLPLTDPYRVSQRSLSHLRYLAHGSLRLSRCQFSISEQRSVLRHTFPARTTLPQHRSTSQEICAGCEVEKGSRVETVQAMEEWRCVRAA